MVWVNIVLCSVAQTWESMFYESRWYNSIEVIIST